MRCTERRKKSSLRSTSHGVMHSGPRMSPRIKQRQSRLTKFFFILLKRQMNVAKSKMKSKNLLPDHFRQYFWDSPFSGRELIDWPEHTIERVLEYAQWKDVRLLREIVGDKAIRDVIISSRKLSPRTVNIWSILLRIPRSKISCFRKPSHMMPLG